MGKKQDYQEPFFPELMSQSGGGGGDDLEKQKMEQETEPSDMVVYIHLSKEMVKVITGCILPDERQTREQAIKSFVKDCLKKGIVKTIRGLKRQFPRYKKTFDGKIKIVNNSKL